MPAQIVPILNLAPRSERGPHSSMPLPTLFLLLTTLLSLPSHAVDGEPLTVATRAVPPFAFTDQAGRWRGIAIELWERVGAELGIDSEYVEVDLDETMAGTASGRFDAAVGALSVTSEREIQFNFTHPFYRTGLGIAVQQDESGGWRAIAKGLVSPRFLAVVAALLVLLALVGAVVWLLERRRNAQFPENPTEGIGAGLWWSSVTMTTVGYGDKAPITLGGRIVGLIWMFASVILISTITASITTALTVDALSSLLSSEEDLASVRTGSVEDSTSARRLRRKGVNFEPYADLDAAMDALAAGKLDAVVYDEPLLRYRVRTEYAGKLHVLDLRFEPQDYAIGLPNDSPWREGVNRLLLKHGRGDAWDALLTRYLGDR